MDLIREIGNLQIAHIQVMHQAASYCDNKTKYIQSIESAPQIYVFQEDAQKDLIYEIMTRSKTSRLLNQKKLELEKLLITKTDLNLSENDVCCIPTTIREDTTQIFSDLLLPPCRQGGNAFHQE